MIPIILILILLLIIIAAFYNGLIIRRYSIKTDKLGDGQSMRAVLLSDLHSHIYGDNQNKLISKIKAQDPDIILLAGDIANYVIPIEGTELLLHGIQNIAPVFYVSGNHEYWSDNIENIKEMIRSYGVIILEDEYKEIVVNDIPLIIAGVDDPEWSRYEKKNNRKSMATNFSGLEDEHQFKILIAHRPELIELYKKYPFDLVVSGHAHGGQVRIPFLLNGLLAPNQGWFPKYAGGMYKHGGLTHIVSRGISFNPRLPRIFNPPEIVVIDIAK